MFAFLWGALPCVAGLVSRCLGVCLLLAGAWIAAAIPACADDGPEDPARSVAESERAVAREIWSGAENLGSSWAFYTGLTAAAGDVTQPGPRLRLVAGMSTYAYAGTSGRARAAQPFADLLGGYQWQMGALTLKAFAGATGSADIRTSDQALDVWGQARIGAKVVGESWWTIDANRWSSLDVAYASQSSTLWSRVRYGQRVLPQLSLGPEAGVAGELSRLGGRVGAFARFDWATGEVALSGGLSGRPGASTSGLVAAEKSGATPYFAVIWLQRF